MKRNFSLFLFFQKTQMRLLGSWQVSLACFFTSLLSISCQSSRSRKTRKRSGCDLRSKISECSADSSSWQLSASLKEADFRDWRTILIYLNASTCLFEKNNLSQLVFTTSDLSTKGSFSMRDKKNVKNV